MSRISLRALAIVSLAALYLGFACPVSAQQPGVGSLIPFAELGVPKAIPKPALSQQGGTLILSDSPERLADTGELPAAMYRGRVEGQFRVFYHHQNVGPNVLSVGVAITNTEDEPELLLGQGDGQGVNIYPDVAGQTALSEFLSSRRRIGFLAILHPGQTYWSVQNVPQGDTASAIQQFAVITVAGQSTTASSLVNLTATLTQASTRDEDSAGGAPLSDVLPPGFGVGAATITTGAYSGEQPSDATILPILPADVHIRGTFPHFDRFGAFSLETQGGLQALSVDTAPPGHPFSNAMPGEYEFGTDVVDGGTQVYNNGNYGVLYRFQVSVQNNQSGQLPFAVLMQPSGGAGHYAMLTNGTLALSPFVNYKSAWWFDSLTLHSPVTVINLQTSLTGGSAGPQKLLFDPGFSDK